MNQLTPNMFVGADQQTVQLFGIRNTPKADQYQYLMCVLYNNHGQFLGDVILTQENLDTLSRDLPADEFIYIVTDRDSFIVKRHGCNREYKTEVPPAKLASLARYVVKRGCIGAFNHKNRYGKSKTYTPSSSGCTFRVIAST